MNVLSDARHVVLIHGAWFRGDSWTPTRAAFERRGYTVHTPTLRHHELPLPEGASKIAPLSLSDYINDLVALITSLDSPPLLVGLSLGGLLAQLVAARTPHAGVVLGSTSPAPGIGVLANPREVGTFLSIFHRHYLRPRPWAKPVYPTTWPRWRRWIANAQTEQVARELFADLVCESGRATWELSFPYLDRRKTAIVNFAAITSPVLTIGGECDRLTPTKVARKTAACYQKGSFVEIPGSDHLVFFGDALATTMSRIDDWILENQVFSKV